MNFMSYKPQSFAVELSTIPKFHSYITGGSFRTYFTSVKGFYVIDRVAERQGSAIVIIAVYSKETTEG